MPGSSYPRIFDFMHCVCVKAWLATTNVLVKSTANESRQRHTIPCFSISFIRNTSESFFTGCRNLTMAMSKKNCAVIPGVSMYSKTYDPRLVVPESSGAVPDLAAIAEQAGIATITRQVTRKAVMKQLMVHSPVVFAIMRIT